MRRASARASLCDMTAWGKSSFVKAKTPIYVQENRGIKKCTENLNCKTFQHWRANFLAFNLGCIIGGKKEEKYKKLQQGREYLNYKVTPFAVQEHVCSPIELRHYFVSYGTKTKLIPGGKTVDFIEPETCEEIRDRGMLSYYHTAFGDI